MKSQFNSKEFMKKDMEVCNSSRNIVPYLKTFDTNIVKKYNISLN